MLLEPEITAPVELCTPDGGLNPAAVGWSRAPLHRSNLRGWGRTKRWEYWGIVTPRHIVGIVTSSLDYAGLHSVYVFDRSAERVAVNAEAVVPLARGGVLADHADRAASGGGGDVAVTITPGERGMSVRATAPDFDIDVTTARRGDCLGVVVPWSRRRFQYTVKDVGRTAAGTMSLHGEQVAIEPAESFAVLDHGRGKWPYRVTWNWAAAATPGGPALQLGGTWTDGGMTENALFLDGRAHKISEDLRWEYDLADAESDWRITGQRVAVTMRPFHVRDSATNLGVIASRTRQCFGIFDGWALTDDDTRVELNGLCGWAEEARHRW